MKKYFITGLLIWIPLIITIWVLKFIFDVLDQSLLLLPVALQTESWLGVHIPGLGAIFTLVVVFVTGLLATNFLGARLVQLWNSVLHEQHFFELAGDLTVAVEFLLSDEEAEALLGLLRREQVRVFYATFAAEFGMIEGTT